MGRAPTVPVLIKIHVDSPLKREPNTTIKKVNQEMHQKHAEKAMQCTKQPDGSIARGTCLLHSSILHTYILRDTLLLTIFA